MTAGGGVSGLSSTQHEAAPQILTAARIGAIVGIFYGVIETAFEVLIPWLRRGAARFVPELIPRVGDLGTSPAFTALALLTYSAFGSAICALIGLIFSGAEAERRLLSRVDVHTLWSGVAASSFVSAILTYGIAAKNPLIVYASILPMAMSVGRAMSAWSRKWKARLNDFTIPIVVFTVLVGTTVLAQPRPYFSVVTSSAAASLCVIAAVSGYGIVARRWRAKGYHPAGNRWFLNGGAIAAWAGIGAVCLSFLIPKSEVRMRPALTMRSRIDRPNVIIITLDTVRADHLSLYGYSRLTTPNLARLAKTASLYPRAVAPSNTTVSSHASLFTGMYPHHHGAHATPQHRAGFSISPSTQTLAEILQRQGYFTVGIVANAGALSPAFGFDRGFTSYECVWLTGFWSPARTHLLRELLLNVTASILDESRRENLIARADEISSRAALFLKTAEHSERPFLLFLNFMDAHAPYTPPAPFDHLFPGKDSSFRWRRYPEIVDKVFRHRSQSMTAHDLQHLTSQYDGGIAYADHEVGRVIDDLKAAGLFDKALLIVTSDHGEAFGENFVVGHGISVYEHQVHVPLIIKYPGQHSPITVTSLVSGTDIFPTVLDVASLPQRGGVDGLSLRQEASASRVVISESYFARGQGCDSSGDGPAELAMYSDRYKQVLGGTGARALYDLATDAGEKDNILGRITVPEKTRIGFARVVSGWGRGVRAEPVTDEETLSRLRALGYLQ